MLTVGRTMKVLVACEFSDVVRNAFTKKGHLAMSCDFLKSDTIGLHYQQHVSNILDGWIPARFFPALENLPDFDTPSKLEYRKTVGDLMVRSLVAPHWDLMVAHPPCTHLAVSGARWFKGKEKEQNRAIDFFIELTEAPINKIAVENPISIMSTRYRKPTQIIQPWMFGHGETKATCLWLKNLPALIPTNIVEGREARIHKLPPSKDRWKLRSITYQGIADAMADQWGEQ